MLPRRNPDGNVVAVYLEPSGHHSAKGSYLVTTLLAFALWQPHGSKYTATISLSGRHLSNILMCADRFFLIHKTIIDDTPLLFITQITILLAKQIIFLYNDNVLFYFSV
jgi:hypothetical protein